MLFSTIVKENWVFCIWLDDEFRKYILKQMDWVKSNPDVHSCEINVLSYSAKFMKREDYDLYMNYGPIGPSNPETPLDYYGFFINYGIPNDAYWNDEYLTPNKTWLFISNELVKFNFRANGQHYKTSHGIDRKQIESGSM